MIQKIILFGILCLSSGLVASCNDLYHEAGKDELIPIEPPYKPMFQFDEQGIPYRLNSPTLSQEMQQDVRNEAFGYGWMWMQTFEILDNGFVDPEDMYASSYGPSPVSYYFKSEKELVSYFYSGAINKACYLNKGFTYEPETGVLSDGDKPMGLQPWTFYLHIWSIYNLNGRWYMSTIEPHGIRSDGNGGYKNVWGYSHYYRMSDEELRKMQAKYTWDYSQVN